MRKMFTGLRSKIAVIGAVAILGAVMVVPGAVHADSVKVSSIDTEKVTGSTIQERIGPRSGGGDSVVVSAKLATQGDLDSGFPALGSHVPYPESIAMLTQRIGPRDGGTGSFTQTLVVTYGNFPVLGSHVPYPNSQASITEQFGPRATDVAASSLAQASSTSSMLLADPRGPYSLAASDVTGGNLPIRGAHVPLNR